MKPLSSLPLHALKLLSPEHKAIVHEAMEMYLDALSAGPFLTEGEWNTDQYHAEKAVCESILNHTNRVPFKSIGTPNWTPDWKNGKLKCTFPSFTGQVPVLDLRARLDGFLKRMNKSPKNWRMFAAKLDRETNIITFWAQDTALKKRNDAERRKELRGGEKVKRGKKKAKVNTHVENMQAARNLSTDELIKLAQARGVTI